MWRLILNKRVCEEYILNMLAGFEHLTFRRASFPNVSLLDRLGGVKSTQTKNFDVQYM